MILEGHNKGSYIFLLNKKASYMSEVEVWEFFEITGRGDIRYITNVGDCYFDNYINSLKQADSVHAREFVVRILNNKIRYR